MPSEALMAMIAKREATSMVAQTPELTERGPEESSRAVVPTPEPVKLSLDVGKGGGSAKDRDKKSHRRDGEIKKDGESRHHKKNKGLDAFDVPPLKVTSRKEGMLRMRSQLNQLVRECDQVLSLDG